MKLPTCARRFPRDIGKERPCLNLHIGKCDGFCRPDGPDQAEYRRRIEQAAHIFTGHYRALTKELQEEMEQAAEAQKSFRDLPFARVCSTGWFVI